MDSQELADEFTRQATIKYQSGEYELDILDAFGQRVNISISLTNQNNGKAINFSAGFMVYPNGKIALVTPYGDNI